jgi:sortase (surface protein transpeptidase)
MKRVQVGLAAALVLVGCGAAPEARDGLPPVERPASSDVVTAVTAAPGERRAARRVAIPVRVEIPAIGVDAPLVRLGLDRTRSLDVPVRFDVAGWWTGGTRPGERGPAVIAGHVDSKTGPAIFYRLGKLGRGDAITVERRDGSTVRFIVRDVGHYAKTAFPTKQVYGATPRPTLRLITCSGDFDRSTGHYVDNTVIYAEIP